MSGKQVVFIIQPIEETNAHKEEWSHVIRHTALKLLTHFSENSPWKSDTSIKFQENHELKWTYKFMNTKNGRLYRTKQDMKNFSVEEFSFFENEIRYLATECSHGKAEKTSEGILSGGAHILSEELMAVVHDYTWETSDMISPLKLSKKRIKSFTRNKKRQSKERVGIEFSDRYYKGSCGKHDCNFVVLMCPCPLTQSELDSYFEWHADSLEYITNKLMPSHLSAHFRERHNIKLIWCDTRLSDAVSTPADFAGLNLMEKFLLSVGGCILPFAALSSPLESAQSALSSIRNDAGDNNKDLSQTCHNSLVHSVPAFCIFHRYLRAKALSNAEFPYILHVCKKVLNMQGQFQIEKMCTFITRCSDPVTKSMMSILTQECALCIPDPAHSQHFSRDTCQLEFSAANTADIYNTNITYPGKCQEMLRQRGGSVSESVLLFVGTTTVKKIAKKINLLSSSTMLNSIWCSLLAEYDAKSRLCSPHANKDTVYVLKMYKYCKNCGGEPSLDCSSKSRYALLQTVTSQLASITFLSSKCGPMMLEILRSDTCHPTVQQQLLPINISDLSASSHSAKSGKISDEQRGFNKSVFFPDMLDRWFSAAADVNLEPASVRTKNQESIGDSEVYDEIVNLLHEHYKETKNSSKLKDGKAESKEDTSTVATSEFESEEAMITVLKHEYDKALKSVLDLSGPHLPQDICGYIVQTAQSIMSVLFHHTQCTDDVDWKSKAGVVAERDFLCSAGDIRKKHADEDNGKTQESLMQILLRLELSGRNLQTDEWIEDTAEEIISLLRLISLSHSPAVMSACLKNICVENYASTCGELLYIVHADLMQPIPNELQQFAKENGDISSVMVSSINTILNSVASSNPSVCSSGPESNSNHRRSIRNFPSFVPKISRQIEVPGICKQVKANIKCSQNDKDSSGENIKSRLRSSTKKEYPTETSSKDVGSVRRDLFATTDTEKKVLVPHEKNAEIQKPRRLTVSDTPDAKQKMTAFTRQRLRMRREKRKECEGLLPVIEESPAKLEGISNSALADLERSPRHKLMLARRHSFYREGKQSRTVARAKIIHQHKHAVLATPEASRKLQNIGKDDLTSANSLLFVRTSGSPFLSPKRNSAARLTSEDSPAKNTRSQATKALFLSPQKIVKISQISSVPDNLKPVLDDNSGEIFGIEPIICSPMKTPVKHSTALSANKPIISTPKKTPKKDSKDLFPKKQKADDWLSLITSRNHFTSYEIPALSGVESSNSVSEEGDDETNNCVDETILQADLRMENQVNLDVTRNIVLPDNGCDQDGISTAEDALPVINLSPSHSSKTLKTLDDYIIRTPRSTTGSVSRSNTGIRKTQKRKWSVDTTPTRDDINQWPRKKRGVDKSSPGVVSKKTKTVCSPKQSNEIGSDFCSISCRNVDAILNQSFSDDEGMLMSPDNGLIVIEDVPGSSKGVAKSCPVACARPLPALQQIFNKNTDANKNIVSEQPSAYGTLTPLPPTPQLHRAIPRHRIRSAFSTKKTRSFFNSGTSKAAEDWDDVFPLEDGGGMEDAIHQNADNPCSSTQAPNSILNKNPLDSCSGSVGLSAKSLLHLQNSPILTPRRKRTSQSVH